MYSPPTRYSPDQILTIQAATLDPSLTSRLRDLGIGCLLRKPSSRGGRRKLRKIAVVCDGAARLTTQPPNDLLQRPSSARRSVSNLITVVPSGDSHASTETAHNSRLTMAYSVNAQSVHEIAGEIHDFIVDNKHDALILTETWLQEVGDEPCIKEMTLPDYVFHSFPRVGRRGGGIAVLMSQSLAPKVTFRCLSYASFEAVMMCLFAKKLVHLTVVYLVNKISSRQKCFYRTSSRF